MAIFDVSLSTTRDKMHLIKFMKAFTTFGLKESKDWVERTIAFGDVNNYVAMTIRVTAEQLGYMMAYIHDPNYAHGEFHISTVIPIEQVPENTFDLTPHA